MGVVSLVWTELFLMTKTDQPGEETWWAPSTLGANAGKADRVVCFYRKTILPWSIAMSTGGSATIGNAGMFTPLRLFSRETTVPHRNSEGQIYGV